MINQTWWFTTLLMKQFKYCPPLDKDIKCDVLIVGGGMSGISAAAEFMRPGLHVVMIKKNIIGGSSTSSSAGFLTPDSELELHQLVRRYGVEAARDIWEMAVRGSERLVENIKKFEIECGLLKQNSLFLGLGQGGKEAVEEELKCRRDVGFTDQNLYDVAGLKRHDGRREVQRGHPLRRHLRRQSAALRAGFQGPVHREWHRSLREHGDGAARGPHRPCARRQRHRRPHHHRRRQAGKVDLRTSPTRSSMPRRFSASASR